MSNKCEGVKNVLLIIDPQNDFHEGGSLAVKGALEDSKKIAGLIRSHKFDAIYVTMDTHQYVDIGHSIWWIDEKEEEPKPLTIITAKDVEEGKWRAARPENQNWSLAYVKKLEANKRFQHTIWPYHCIVGTKGHEITESINDALSEWAKENRQLVCYMWKGTNPKAEMYSAFKADVEVPGADETKLNKQVLDRLYRSENIVICGQASSHCVRHSVDDMVKYFKDKRGDTPKLYLMSDCSSPVAGYEKTTEQFLKDINQCKFLSVMHSTQLKI